MIPPTKTVIDEPHAESANDPDAEMTPEQTAELRALCEDLDEPFDASLTERQAAERIDALKAQKSG